MRLAIPLTGTVLVEGSLTDGLLTGDDKDPIRPVDINLGNVSWTMVSLDLENEVMVIEVKPAERINEPTGEIDGESNPIYRTRPATEEEKAALLQYAQGLVVNHTKDELFAISGCPRLKRPFKVI